MYRFRTIAQVKYGHFKEYWEISRQLDQLTRERGWTAFTYHGWFRRNTVLLASSKTRTCLWPTNAA